MPASPPEAAAPPRPERLRPLWIYAAIVLATLAAYAPALGGGFLWDDDAHLTRPALRSLHGLGRIWFEPGATPQYAPLLHSLFWIEHRLWGDAALGYHLANVLGHAIAACLLARLLRRLFSGWAAPAFAALLFALHPVAVESVAWISQQGNPLAAIGCLAAALTYLRSDRDRNRGPLEAVAPPERNSVNRSPDASYVVATGLFVLALLSQAAAAPLPGALLVIGWWQRGRLSWRRDVRWLLPWFVLGGAALLLTAGVEPAFPGDPGSDFGLSLVERGLLAGRAVWFYAGKLAWPADLIFNYPRWTVDGGAAGSYGFPLALLAVLAGLGFLARRMRGPLAAALLFVGALSPVLGFFHLPAFIFSFVADHFQYLASLGFMAAVAGGWAGREARWPRRGAAAGRALALLLVAVLGALTWRQCRLYRDPAALYGASLERNPDAWLLDSELGNLLLRRGRVPEAERHYERALRGNPSYAPARRNLGDIYLNTGRPGAAIEQFKAALYLQPDSADVYLNLGNALGQAGHWPEAIAEYGEVLRREPASAAAHDALGNALGGLGRWDEAMSHYERALRIDSGDAQAQNGLGAALFHGGEVGGAIVHYERALQLKPDFAEARYNLGNALMRVGRADAAIAQYRQALPLEPRWADLHFNLGEALSADGRMAEASDQYEEALRLRPDDRQTEYQLAVALRALGRNDEAGLHFARAAALAAP
jgi:tetratricopeptide (TPR) repeat protein